MINSRLLRFRWPALTRAGWLVLLATAATVRAALPPHAEIRAAFDALDTSGNGGISIYEWHTASVALFERSDKDHDGSIDRSEIGDNALMREAFPDADKHADGKLSRDEFLALRDTIFRSADIDHDDNINFVEYEILVLLRRTGWRDRDDDGHIDMSELGGILRNAFPLLDLNHDGVLTGDETAFLAPNHIEAMDPKHTGRITPEQFLNGYRWLLGADMTNRNLVPRSVPLKS